MKTIGEQCNECCHRVVEYCYLLKCMHEVRQSCEGCMDEHKGLSDTKCVQCRRWEHLSKAVIRQNMKDYWRKKMIRLKKTEVVGIEHAIRGMRNPMNSWDKSDSGMRCSQNPNDVCSADCTADNYCKPYNEILIGENDLSLMNRLARSGSVHAKYRRMIVVYADITAPLYWWKEFDTYKVGTVANSCSTMHKIHEKEFTLDDFSCEHLLSLVDAGAGFNYDVPIPDSDNTNNTNIGKMCTAPLNMMQTIIDMLNVYRYRFIKTKDKKYWWQMIQLLPSSYNQKRTVMLNYEVLANMYYWRKDHKLDEWVNFCKWIEQLPYSELITGTNHDDD